MNKKIPTDYFDICVKMSRWLNILAKQNIVVRMISRIKRCNLMTTVYLIRHSKPLNVQNTYTNDSLQLQNEKKILSTEGEKIAKEKFKSYIFNHLE